MDGFLKLTTQQKYPPSYVKKVKVFMPHLNDGDSPTKYAYNSLWLWLKVVLDKDTTQLFLGCVTWHISVNLSKTPCFYDDKNINS